MDEMEYEEGEEAGLGGAIADNGEEDCTEKEDEVYTSVMSRLEECDEEHDRTIFYTLGENTESFDAWLKSHLPSNINGAKDGIDWVYVYRPIPGDRYLEDVDREGLLFSWENFIRSGRPITFKAIVELAGNYNVTSGKWMFFAGHGVKIDLLWQKVAIGIGSSSCLHSAKVSTTHLPKTGPYVVCIYNRDFRNREQVFQWERAIRDLGIKCPLMYKPDVYTYINIYRKNPWGFKPTIYESMFDIKTGNSVFTSDVMEI